MPIISRLRKSPDLWQNITLQYAHDFKAGFVTKFMAKYYPIVCPEFLGKKNHQIYGKILPCRLPMILRLDLLQNLWQVFTCVEYAHNIKAKNSPDLWQNITL